MSTHCDEHQYRSSTSIASDTTLSRSSSTTSRSRLINTGLDGQAPLSRNRRDDRPAPRLVQKRFRLPWLDGNNNSSQIPGTFDTEAGTEATGFSSTAHTQPSPQVQGDETTSKASALAIQIPSPASPNVNASSDGPYHPKRSSPSPAGPSDLSSPSLSPIPGRWPTFSGGQPQYTPSMYSSDPPSEYGMPSRLSRRDPVSYENLVAKPVDSPPTEHGRSPMWPMVPLSETDIPTRISSLSFWEPIKRSDSYLRPSKSAYELRGGGSPSSIGRYTDGTISRKPTVRTSTKQAQLDRAATSRLLRSPDVSPKSSAPPYLTSSTAGPSHDQDSKSLERAVTGLQNLMHEALSVAAEAAQSNQAHEVVEILNEATIALRKANTVQGRMTEPLRLSDPEMGGNSSSDCYISGSESDGYVESETSSVDHRRQPSNETAPTYYTKSKSALSINPAVAPFVNSSPLPLEIATNDSTHPGDTLFHATQGQQASLNPPYLRHGRRPQSERGSFDASRPDNCFLPSSSGSNSITQTPPAMYHQPSADSVVTDWAYVKRVPGRRELREDSKAQRTVLAPSEDAKAVIAPAPIRAPTQEQMKFLSRASPAEIQEGSTVIEHKRISLPEVPRDRGLRQITSQAPAQRLVQVQNQTQKLNKPSQGFQRISDQGPRHGHTPHLNISRLFDATYYKVPDKERDGLGGANTQESRNHISLDENQTFRLHRYRRQPVAREWTTTRKRITAAVACLNTALIGLTAGIYAGEVPKIQYQLADEHHRVILGNVLLYAGMGLPTVFAWPLPLLHGRKPYTLAALAIALPLNFPQAVVVGAHRSPDPQYFVGLLLPRAFMGMALGFANINFLTTLFDMFGASLQSSNPHQEIVTTDDVRRQGGGMGLWLGIWAWCFVGSLSIGFLIGAGITAHLNPAWGFYIVVIIIAAFMLMNVIAPETRRAPYRRSVLKYLDKDEKIRRRVARGEIKLHISMDGPKYWWEEVLAGLQLMGSMMLQPGFFVLAFYLAWIYALVVLVTLLLGALLSRDYGWHPQYIGLAVFALAIGAALAVPLSKANIFSRDRMQPARTDSMTFQPRITWTSHLIRRCLFTFALPIAGLAYVLSSKGRSVSWAAPTILSGLVGFLSCLAVAECIGLVMETFDTSDLQPGVNTKHRLLSMESATRRRRTNYSSFPRVTAGLFTAQALGFFLAAAATGVSGRITRALGAQAATGVVIGILLIFTMLLSMVLWRFRSVQVIPNHALGTARDSVDWQAREAEHDPYFKPVIIGNPSGKMRRMNVLETGSWSRWTEIRKLNKLIKHKQ